MNIIIVAYDRNRVIGQNGSIPWNLPEDIQLFKERTTGHIVVMGRKTWESLPKNSRPLKNRLNVVVTGDPALHDSLFMSEWSKTHDQTDVPNVFFVSPEFSLKMLRNNTDKPNFIIGGSTFYSHCLSSGVVDRVVASEVNGEHEGDAFFPELGNEWKAISSKPYNKFRVVEYVKD